MQRSRRAQNPAIASKGACHSRARLHAPPSLSLSNRAFRGPARRRRCRCLLPASPPLPFACFLLSRLPNLNHRPRVAIAQSRSVARKTQNPATRTMTVSTDAGSKLEMSNSSSPSVAAGGAPPGDEAGRSRPTPDKHHLTSCTAPTRRVAFNRGFKLSQALRILPSPDCARPELSLTSCFLPVPKPRPSW